jgi:hypothetical protein
MPEERNDLRELLDQKEAELLKFVYSFIHMCIYCLGHQEVELKDWKTLSLTILQMMRILSVIK